LETLVLIPNSFTLQEGKKKRIKKQRAKPGNGFACLVGSRFVKEEMD
jgi:hypothetical protein